MGDSATVADQQWAEKRRRCVELCDELDALWFSVSRPVAQVRMRAEVAR